MACIILCSGFWMGVKGLSEVYIRDFYGSHPHYMKNNSCDSPIKITIEEFEAKEEDKSIARYYFVDVPYEAYEPNKDLDPAAPDMTPASSEMRESPPHCSYDIILVGTHKWKLIRECDTGMK